MTKTSTKTCDHCGTPAKRRYAVRVTKRGHTKVAMVGSSCAKRFPRANQSDLILSIRRDRATGNEPMEITTFHADHGISEDTIRWAVETISPSGFFLRTLTLPAGYKDVMNALYGPASGDEPIKESAVHYAKRSPDRPPSRMIAKPSRPTRKITIIGMAEGGKVTVFTCYGGPAAEREPADPTLSDAERSAATAFWAEHALADVSLNKSSAKAKYKNKSSETTWAKLAMKMMDEHGLQEKMWTHRQDFPSRLELRKLEGEPKRSKPVCDICRKDFRLWLTGDKNWEMLPIALQACVFCQPCYKRIIDLGNVWRIKSKFGFTRGGKINFERPEGAGCDPRLIRMLREEFGIQIGRAKRAK